MRSQVQIHLGAKTLGYLRMCLNLGGHSQPVLVQAEGTGHRYPMELVEVCTSWPRSHDYKIIVIVNEHKYFFLIKLISITVS